MNFFKFFFLIYFAFVFYILSAVTFIQVEADPKAGREADVPVEIYQFLPKGFYPVYFKNWDLNNDGLLDYLVVLQENALKPENWKNNGKASFDTWPLIILTRSADGRLNKVVENNKILPWWICSGSYDYQRLCSKVIVTKEGISIRVYMRTWPYIFMGYFKNVLHEFHEFKFSYSMNDNVWKLKRADRGIYFPSIPNQLFIKQSKSPKDFDQIELQDFDPEKIEKFFR